MYTTVSHLATKDSYASSTFLFFIPDRASIRMCVLSLKQTTEHNSALMKNPILGRNTYPMPDEY